MMSAVSNPRRQPTPRPGCVCILRQWRGAAAADRSVTGTRMMKVFVASLLLGLTGLAQATDAGSRTNEFLAARSEITCRAAYYRRVQDGHLIPAAEAQSGQTFRVDGVVLTIVEPDQFKGGVVAFHFDFPEDWDDWYLPDCLYRGEVPKREIGTLSFMCDPGCLLPVTDPLP